MKYAIIIPDGCADLPVESLGGLTPMQAAATPCLDHLACSGIVGRSQNVPVGLPPGSDVATLGLLGYDPARYYTGRAPLEAAAQGIELGPDDWAIRCNLVCVADGPQGKFMQSFTAGHISSEEAAELMHALNEWLALPEVQKIMPIPVRFYPSVSYRNLGITLATVPPLTVPLSAATQTYPPHDFTDKPIAPALPTGDGSDWLRQMMDASRIVFAEHPVNQRRREQGKLPATQIWLWGLGKRPQLPLFSERFADALRGKRLRGGMITAVDLLRGIASLIGWENIKVPGITGYVDTDYAAKGRYAVDALKEFDIVCVHVEATDEAGHEGNTEKKVKAMEEIDAKIVAPILEALKSYGDWRLFVSPDHPTPVALKTHTSDYVPWLLAGSDVQSDSADRYDEDAARCSTYRFDEGWKMLELLLK